MDRRSLVTWLLFTLGLPLSRWLPRLREFGLPRSSGVEVRYRRFLRCEPGWRSLDRERERDCDDSDGRLRLRPLALDMERLEYRRGRLAGLSPRLIRRRKGDRDLLRDLLVEMVETESTDEAERDRVFLGDDGCATGLLDRRSAASASLFASACASTSSATPLLERSQ